MNILTQAFASFPKSTHSTITTQTGLTIMIVLRNESGKIIAALRNKDLKAEYYLQVGNSYASIVGPEAEGGMYWPAKFPFPRHLFNY